MKTKLKIIIPTILAIIAVIIAAVCISFSPNASKNIEEMFSTAQKYLVEQNYEQAVAEFSKIIELDPMNADAYLGLAQTYIEMGDTEKAVEMLEKGFELTQDERIKALLDELLREEKAENLLVTESQTTAMTTEITEPISLIPNFCGLSASEAASLCGQLNLSFEIKVSENEQTENGIVFSQSIEEGTVISDDIKIILTISGNIVTTTSEVPVVTETVTAVTTDTVLMTEIVTTTEETTAITTEKTTAETAETTSVTTEESNMEEECIFIRGEQYSISLKELDLSNEFLEDKDIVDLYKMTELETLKINYGNLKDISVLSKLKNLKHLELEWNKITDLSALSGLTNLRYLDLSGNFNSDRANEARELVHFDDEDLYVVPPTNQEKYNSAFCNDLTPLYNLKQLEYLALPVIYDDEEGNESKIQLKNALPNCEIVEE